MFKKLSVVSCQWRKRIQNWKYYISIQSCYAFLLSNSGLCHIKKSIGEFILLCIVLKTKAKIFYEKQNLPALLSFFFSFFNLHVQGRSIQNNHKCHGKSTGRKCFPLQSFHLFSSSLLSDGRVKNKNLIHSHSVELNYRTGCHRIF